MTLGIFSCKVNEKPVFLGVENIEVIEVTSEHILINADANFENPNHIGGKLISDELNILINDVQMVSLSSEEFNVPAKDLFVVPLKAEVQTHEIFRENSLGSVLESLLLRTVNVSYQGIIKYKVLGFSYNYEVDITEEIKLKI